MSHQKHRTETNCLNCGTEVHGNYCSNCGQENIETHQNFFNLVAHFSADYLHFDSKFFKSVIPLIVKPGFLTEEYWAGRRVTYIPPLRLFFFITIIFMVCTSYFYSHYGSELKKSMVNRDKKIASYDSTYVASLSDTTMIFDNRVNKKVQAKELKKDMVTAERQFRKLNNGVDFVFKNLKYVTFFLLPVYALIFKVLYRRRRPFYVDHLVYVMHLQSFSYVLMGLLIFTPLIIPFELTILRQIILTVLLIYIGISLHHLYHQVWWKTLLKSLLAVFSLFFVTVIVILITTLLDAMFIQ